jgi:hypothetical protein
MPERIRKNQRQREFVRGAEAAGNEIISRGLPFAITIPRREPPTQENTKFIWIRRPVVKKTTKDAGLTKKQLKVISILEAVGLGKMVVRI